MLASSLLDTYEGHSISEICPHGYDNTGYNHCAHFASHVMQIDFGYTGKQRHARSPISHVTFDSYGIL